jgi:elongation factor Ts
MAISAKAVAELRGRTGAGMMDCKKALTEADGDMEKAAEVLQKKGLAAVAKRAGREASEGLIGSYIHGGRIGAMVELNCETDFVANTDEFQALVKDLCMHVAAANPLYLDDSQIPEAAVAKQSELFKDQMKDEGKPEHILEKIIEGKLKKWRKEICLLDQPFVKDPDINVRDYITNAAATIKENVQLRRFARFELGGS